MIQLAFGTDKGFGVSFLFTLPFTRICVWFTLPVKLRRITRDLVTEFRRLGEANDRSIALHPHWHLDALELNLLGLAESLILFDFVQCGFQLCGVVFHLSLVIGDELFVCLVPLLWIFRFV